jgi:hypothetical protein
MALPKMPFGKDKVARSSEGFISEALTGGHGPSEGMSSKKIDRPDQSILTAVAMDNVDLAMPIETSILDTTGIAGGVDNLKHSLTGASVVNEEVGAAGKIKHIIIPSH